MEVKRPKKKKKETKKKMLVIQGGRGSVLEGRNNEADARDVKQDRRGLCLKKKKTPV